MDKRYLAPESRHLSKIKKTIVEWNLRLSRQYLRWFCRNFFEVEIDDSFVFGNVIIHLFYYFIIIETQCWTGQPFQIKMNADVLLFGKIIGTGFIVKGVGWKIQYIFNHKLDHWINIILFFGRICCVFGCIKVNWVDAQIQGLNNKQEDKELTKDISDKAVHIRVQR